MKHIIKYSLFEAWRPKEFNPIQQEFMKLFLEKCDELGIKVENLATELQKKNNTWIINLPVADVLKLFLDSGWDSFTKGIRKTKANRLLANPMFRLISASLTKKTAQHPALAHWIIANNNIRQIIRPWSGGGQQHSSTRDVVFSEVQSVEDVLGLFYNQLTLVINNQIARMLYYLDNNQAEPLIANKVFDAASLDQIKDSIKKYPDFNWNEIFAKADLPQATFKEILGSPDFSEELKRLALNNPNYADYNKVEDVLGDWE